MVVGKLFLLRFAFPHLRGFFFLLLADEHKTAGVEANYIIYKAGALDKAQFFRRRNVGEGIGFLSQIDGRSDLFFGTFPGKDQHPSLGGDDLQVTYLQGGMGLL